MAPKPSAWNGSLYKCLQSNLALLSGLPRVSRCIEEWISTRMGMFSSPSSSSGFSTQAGKRPVTQSKTLVLKGHCLSRLFSFALSFFPSFFLVSLSLSLCLNEMSGYRTDNTASDCQCFPRNMLTKKDCFVARHSA